jgi:RHS repeat-associated protein
MHSRCARRSDNEGGLRCSFDDFKVEQVKSPVVQMDDYYPFGLKFNGYQRENSVQQNYLYNGKELQAGLNLGWLDYGARMYMPEIGRWGVMDLHTGKYEITSPYNYAFNNPLLFVDPTGMDNIIYLIVPDNDRKVKAKDIEKAANKMLSDLGLSKIQVKIFDIKTNGKFNPRKLDKTDGWAVVGSNRKEVSRIARSVDRQDNRRNRDRYPDGKSDYETFIDDFEKRVDNERNPEISDRGIDNKDGKGRGISVDTEDIPEEWKPYRTFWAALSTIHGAGHNASGSHIEEGVMADGNGLARQWAENGSKGILDKANNAYYIQIMLQRFSSDKPVDNYNSKNKR